MRKVVEYSLSGGQYQAATYNQKERFTDMVKCVKVDGRKVDRLDAALLRAKKEGLTYAEYQMRNTLAMLPPIDTDVRN